MRGYWKDNPEANDHIFVQATHKLRGYWKLACKHLRHSRGSSHSVNERLLEDAGILGCGTGCSSHSVNERLLKVCCPWVFVDLCSSHSVNERLLEVRPWIVAVVSCSSHSVNERLLKMIADVGFACFVQATQ